MYHPYQKSYLIFSAMSQRKKCKIHVYKKEHSPCLNISRILLQSKVLIAIIIFFLLKFYLLVLSLSRCIEIKHNLHCRRHFQHMKCFNFQEKIMFLLFAFLLLRWTEFLQLLMKQKKTKSVSHEKSFLLETSN